MNVFISWSGDRSRIVAEAIRDWLPMVLQFVDAWISADMDKGARWEGEITQKLDAADAGIICLTPENLTKPWILFESGALSKRVPEARVCTLLTDLRPSDVPLPLGMFQSTLINKAEIKNLIQSINRFGKEKAVPEQTVNQLFEATWPQVESQITNLQPLTGVVTKRSTDDMVAELLEASRKQRRTGSEQTILAKLSCIELTMALLSYQRNGVPEFGHLASKVINGSRRWYKGGDDKLQESLEPMWQIAFEILHLAEKRDKRESKTDAAPTHTTQSLPFDSEKP